MSSEIAESPTLRRRAWKVSEVAQQLGIHKASVYRLIYSGVLKTLPGAGDRLISEYELERYLKASRD